MIDKPLTKLRKLSSSKSERFYFKDDPILNDDNFKSGYSVKNSEYVGYMMTGWIDLNSPKHFMLKEATKRYGVEFIPEKMFLEKND